MNVIYVSKETVVNLTMMSKCLSWYRGERSLVKPIDLSGVAVLSASSGLLQAVDPEQRASFRE